MTDLVHRPLQIGQLLASITGEKAATPTSIQPSRSPNGIPRKRKADQDGPGAAFEAPKTASASNGPTNSGASRPYTGSSRPSSSNTSRTLSERPVSAASKKPSLGLAARPAPTYASYSAAFLRATLSRFFCARICSSRASSSLAALAAADSSSSTSEKPASMSDSSESAA